jgi:chromosome segregation ATPase
LGEVVTIDLAAVITALSAGIAAVVGAIAGLRRARRSVGSEVADAVARNAGMFSEALASMEGELAEAKGRLRAIEEELADARRDGLALRDAIAELTGRIDAALMLLGTTSDPAASAAAGVLRAPRKKVAPATKKSAPGRLARAEKPRKAR